MDPDQKRRKSMKPFSTLKKNRPSTSSNRFGFGSTRKSTASTPAGSSRLSMPSASGQHSRLRPSITSVFKDYRQFDKQSVRKAEASYLYEFLRNSGFQNDKLSSVEKLNPPSNQLFQSVFEFLVRCTLPNWRLQGGGKPGDHMWNILRTFGYPFTISKSHLSNVVPGTWQSTLGALSWLSKVAQYSRLHGEEADDPIKKTRNYFFQRSYEEFMDEEDGPETVLQIENEVQSMIDEINAESNREIEILNEEIRQVENSIGIKLNKENEYKELCQEIVEHENRNAACREYAERVKLYVEEKEKLREQVDEENVELEKKQPTIEKEIAQLKANIKLQNYSQSDIKQKQEELKTWQDRNAESDQKHKELEDQSLRSLTTECLKTKQKEIEMMRQVNEQVRKALATSNEEKLIDDAADDDVTNHLLDINETNPRNNKHKLIKVIKPFFSENQEKLNQLLTKFTQETNSVYTELIEAEDENIDLDEKLKKLENENEAVTNQIDKDNEEFLKFKRKETDEGESHRRGTEEKGKETNQLKKEIDSVQEEVENLLKENPKAKEESEKKLVNIFQEEKRKYKILEKELDRERELSRIETEERSKKHQVFMEEFRGDMEKLKEREKQIGEIRKEFEEKQALVREHMHVTPQQQDLIDQLLK